MNFEQVVNSFESWSMTALGIIVCIAVMVALIDYFSNKQFSFIDFCIISCCVQGDEQWKKQIVEV